MNRLAEFADNVGLSILELVADNELFLQVAGLTPRFRAGVKSFAAMMMSFMESAKILAIDKLIKVVIEESGYLKMLHDDSESGKSENVSREENLGAFINSAKEFVELNPDGSLEDFLNHVALITDLDTVDEKESRVKLMTVHAAKGLEFPAVFVVGMEEGLFPHANSLYEEAALEEERRACYVALTRAEKKLYITAARRRMTFGKTDEQKVSRFVEEIPEKFLDSYGFQSTPKVARRKISPTPSYRPPTAHRAAQSTKPPQKKSVTDTAFKVGDKVNHRLWGLGTVMAVDQRTITIAFSNPEIGVKKLLIKIAPLGKL